MSLQAQAKMNGSSPNRLPQFPAPKTSPVMQAHRETRTMKVVVPIWNYPVLCSITLTNEIKLIPVEKGGKQEKILNKKETQNSSVNH